MGCANSALCNNPVLNLHQICTFCLSYEDDTEEFFGLQPSGCHLKNQLHVPLTVTSTVNVIQKSIQLLKNPDEPNLFQLEFLFDSSFPCTIELLHNAKERSLSVPLITRSFPAGFKQLFQFSEKDPWFDFLNLDEDRNDSIIITIRGGRGNKQDSCSQRTICNILVREDHQELVTTQKIEYNGESFIIKEIYGFQQDEDCSVCLTEKKNTVLLPCHHLCVCDCCALVLTTTINKCPICRSFIRSMIQVFPREIEVDEEEAEEVLGDVNDDLIRLNGKYRLPEDINVLREDSIADITLDLSESDAQSDKSI